LNSINSETESTNAQTQHITTVNYQNDLGVLAGANAALAVRHRTSLNRELASSSSSSSQPQFVLLRSDAYLGVVSRFVVVVARYHHNFRVSFAVGT
jgi:hypothetical protein